MILLASRGMDCLMWRLFVIIYGIEDEMIDVLFGF